MTAFPQRLPTQEEIQSMIEEAGQMQNELFEDESKANDIFERAQRNLDWLGYKYSENLKSDERVLARLANTDVRKAAQPFVTAKISSTEEIPDELKAEINKVRGLIRRMEFTGESEQAVQDEMKKLNDYGRLIHKDHPILEKISKEYYNKKADNTMKYLQHGTPSAKRDEGLLRYFTDYGNNFEVNTRQAIMNLLEQRVNK